MKFASRFGDSRLPLKLVFQLLGNQLETLVIISCIAISQQPREFDRSMENGLLIG
jgi:hypothetical protein